MQEYLVEELKIVRRRGLHRLEDIINELPALRKLSTVAIGGERTEDVESLLRTVYRERSEGAQGTAIGIILGLEQGRRGASPQVLREVAAKRLGYASVDTFRKKPELNAMKTFAHLIESYAIEIQNRPEPTADKINEIMRLVEKLTLAEYGDFVRRMRHRMAHLADDRKA